VEALVPLQVRDEFVKLNVMQDAAEGSGFRMRIRSLEIDAEFDSRKVRRR
jgi:hypothetical protein